ncbi:hypothetical protein FIJ19_09275 [Escherichia coli]|nr:hypothetical protein [Escherichia coli]EFN5823400.1 hypothetical protein [Escherichia coli]
MFTLILMRLPPLTHSFESELFEPDRITVMQTCKWISLIVMYIEVCCGVDVRILTNSQGEFYWRQARRMK